MKCDLCKKDDDLRLIRIDGGEELEICQTCYEIFKKNTTIPEFLFIDKVLGEIDEK